MNHRHNPHGQARHAVLAPTTHDEFARQEFVRAHKEYRVKQVHGGNRERYEQAVKPAFTRHHKRPPQDRVGARDVTVQDPYYRMFSTLLRTRQEMLWSSCQKPVERALPALNARINGATNAAGGSLTLDPDLPVPRYHTAVDIHCQPGGYHTEVMSADAALGIVYDRAMHVYAMGQMAPYNDDIGASVVLWLQQQQPPFKPLRILDLGCSVGHRTVPCARGFPNAAVHAIDVAAPTLR